MEEKIQLCSPSKTLSDLSLWFYLGLGKAQIKPRGPRDPLVAANDGYFEPLFTRPLSFPYFLAVEVETTIAMASGLASLAAQ